MHQELQNVQDGNGNRLYTISGRYVPDPTNCLDTRVNIITQPESETVSKIINMLKKKTDFRTTTTKMYLFETMK